RPSRALTARRQHRSHGRWLLAEGKFDDHQRLPQLRRLIGRIGRIDKEGYATGCRHDLAQQLHALGHQFVGKEVDAGGIAARAVETCYQAELDRVTSYAEHDRDRRGRGLSRESSSRGAWRGNHTHLPTNEISHQLWQTIILTVGPAKFGDHVPALDK